MGVRYMSDNKKYYYMRLKDNFFEDETMVILESMPDGYLYSNILLKLYLKSVKSDGKLMFNDYIPYNPQMIATITRHSVGVVEKALKIFKDMGLIEILDDGTIYMLNIQSYIGKSSTEADRKRNYRNKIDCEKAKLGQMSQPMSQKRPPEIEIEKEKELDIEIEKDIKKNKQKKESFVSVIDSYTQDENLKDALSGFVEMRKKEKGFTVRALKLNLTKLNDIALDDYTKVSVVNQSIEHGWKSFYPLKTNNRKGDDLPF